ncbi:segregation/condensation protein A [Microcoleus sp. LEGE 07076]|uniref:segregation/condensation protein A n=1 Tax=Microcoleus sp. LEGE 07076 TaxID=915322 RepID=UPI00187DFA58|nr:segregation/condensation protein A [Microcoleus sp. LEGE 07076]MBE9185788.1 segregation/condensation protein A [Microcoleus sp. LEGE 07076]
MVVSQDKNGLEAISEGIAILIDLAERGEIDPWDVKVIEVFDRCLSQLTNTCDADPSKDFSDLSHSGQAFLYASMLVLLKAESIVLSEPPANPESDEAALEDAEQSGGRHLPQHLERQLRRRGVAQLPQKRPVSLPELIEQLQLMKAAMEQTVAPRRRPTSKMRSQAAQAIFELAHQENLVETASELERFLTERGSEIGEGWLDLEQLLELWHHNNDLHSSVNPEPPLSAGEVDLPNHDRVGIFWALLLLSAQSKVELLQEEFYQDLKIRAL